MSKPPFISGEPPSFLTPNEKAWQAAIQMACPNSLPNPCLRFVVSAWQRNYNYFDLDNISKPVMDVVGKVATTVWVSMDIGKAAGVTITNEIPSSPTQLFEEPIYIANPPSRSTRRSAQLSELDGRGIIGSTEPLGLMLKFDSNEVRVSDFGFEGPIKPLIDSLGPLLGSYHQGPADYRIHEIRIFKGLQPQGRGVTVGFWFLVDSTPTTLQKKKKPC